MNDYDPNRKHIIKAIALIQSIYNEYNTPRDPTGSTLGAYDDGRTYAAFNHVLLILGEEVQSRTNEIQEAGKEMGLGYFL